MKLPRYKILAQETIDSMKGALREWRKEVERLTRIIKEKNKTIDILEGRIMRLKRDLQTATKNDQRDKKGRYTKRKKKQ